jgi:hypothetical protein
LAADVDNRFMPEFINRKIEAQIKELKINEAVGAYLTCAAFADAPEGKDTLYDWHISAIVEAYNVVMEFIQLASMRGDILQDVTDEQLGHDLWLSRNGHGSGFFDRDFEHADLLQEIARGMGSRSVYCTRGKFYFDLG